jgi:FOG: Ankyrin repeat
MTSHTRLQTPVAAVAALMSVTATVLALGLHGPARAAQEPLPAATAAVQTAPADAAHEELFAAIARGDAAGAKAALEKGADPNGVLTGRYDNMPPLHLSVYLGHREIAEALLIKGADPKRTGPEGVPLLGLAVYNHHAALRATEQARAMQAALGADLARSQEDALKNLEAAQKALEQQSGAASGRRKGLLGGLGKAVGGAVRGGLGNLAMAAATGGGSLLSQSLFKQASAGLGRQFLGKALGSGPLGAFAQAALRGNPLGGASALEALAAGHGKGLGDPAQWVNLVQSAAAGDPGALVGLQSLNPGASAEDRTAWGNFLAAAQGGRVEEVKKMLADGSVQGYVTQVQSSFADAMTQMEAEMRARAAAYTAAPADPQAEAALMRLLIEKGAVLDTADSMGVTPLMWAAQAGRADLLALLLEKGADIHRKDGNGFTALDWAGMGTDPAAAEKAVALLKKAGAKSGGA